MTSQNESEHGVIYTSVPIKVAEALLSARAAAGMSQKELAEATGIDQSDISKIERGVANPSLSTLRRLAEGLGMELTVGFSRKTAV